MEDDERDTASLVNGAKNVTFKLEDEDEMVDVEVPVSTSNGDDDGEPTEEADGVVEVESLWLDNTLIAHPAIGIGYFFMLWAALFSRSADLASIFPFMFIPAALGVYWWWKLYRDSVSLTYLQSQFIIGFAPVSLAVTILQLVSLMFWLGIVVSFIEGSKTLLGFVLGVGFYMFMAVTMVEELIKVSVAAHVRQQNAGRADSKSFVAGTVFMSLGLGTAQAIFMAIIIYSAIQSEAYENSDERVDDGGSQNTMLSVMVGVISVAFINIPLHCMCGYLASIRVALRAFSDGLTISSFKDNIQMAVFPAAMRTIFLTLLLVGLVAFDAIGMLLANILGVLIVYYMYKFIKCEEAKLPDEYRERVGYLSVFNDMDTVLGDDDAQEEEDEGVLKDDDDVVAINM